MEARDRELAAKMQELEFQDEPPSGGAAGSGGVVRGTSFLAVPPTSVYSVSGKALCCLPCAVAVGFGFKRDICASMRVGIRFLWWSVPYGSKDHMCVCMRSRFGYNQPYRLAVRPRCRFASLLCGRRYSDTTFKSSTVRICIGFPCGCVLRDAILTSIGRKWKEKGRSHISSLVLEEVL